MAGWDSGRGGVWKLPMATPERPHALKYRLYCGRAGRCLVRYDNEIGKGDHVYYGEQQVPYHFVSRERLMVDFVNDVKRLTRGELRWRDF
jgi:hypothetical protein